MGDFSEFEANQLNAASRVILNKTDDGGTQQLVDYDGVAGEQHTGVLRVQYFGFAGHAPAGSEGVMLTLGNRDMPVVLGAEHPDHKPKDIPEGAAKFYDASGTYVYLDNQGNVFVKGAKSLTIEMGENVTLNCQNMTINASSSFTVNSPSVDINEG